MLRLHSLLAMFRLLPERASVNDVPDLVRIQPCGVINGGGRVVKSDSLVASRTNILETSLHRQTRRRYHDSDWEPSWKWRSALPLAAVCTCSHGVHTHPPSVICSPPCQSQRTRSANVGLQVLKKRRANYPFRHLLLVMSFTLLTKPGVKRWSRRSGREDRRAAL